ncbi:MAG: trigger factor [Sulfuricaulis sp.]|nr:trigger factor [Sulfuricaulis sp.]
MQVSVETVGTLGRRLTVALPAEDVEKEFSTRLTRLSKQVKMPGFRPGKVPLKMIEAQYGASLLQEVAGDLIQTSLREAIGREGLRPAGSPRIAPPQVVRGKQLEYTAEIDLYPEIKRLDLAGVKIERPVATVVPADVEHTLDTIRRQRAAWNVVARAARSGDRVTIDFVGRLNGAEFDGGSAKGFPLVLGTNTLVEDFENGLVGAQAGDARNLTVKFPADYRHTPLAGQTVDFETKVHDVAEAVLPEVNAEFAKLLGIQDGDVARLRDETKANLEREATARSRAVVRARVLKTLLDANPFEAPKGLIADEADHLKQLNQMARRSVETDDAYRNRARTRVALGLILGEIIRAKGLRVDAARVRARIEDMAAEYESPAEFVQWYYEKPERLAEIESLVMEERIVEEMLVSAEVVETPVGFQELLKLEASVR